jgi:tropomyosin
MAALRAEADESAAKVEELKAKVKALESENLAKEQEITSLSHKNQVLEADVEKLESGIKEHKERADSTSHAGSQAESMQRKVQLLEEEAEESDRNIRELNEKYANPIPIPRIYPERASLLATYHKTRVNIYAFRLRQTDVKSGHYERKVQALEASRDQWEAKYEEMAKKYADTKKELNDFVTEIGNI